MIKSYGCTIGIITRYGGGGYFVEESTPTLTTSTGDNLMSVVIETDENDLDFSKDKV